MTASLSIGEYSRATYLSVKTLRHYHEVGLLEPPPHPRKEQQ
jgi:DNA-binding transcriptional MerR regulator